MKSPRFNCPSLISLAATMICLVGTFLLFLAPVTQPGSGIHSGSPPRTSAALPAESLNSAAPVTPLGDHVSTFAADEPMKPHSALPTRDSALPRRFAMLAADGSEISTQLVSHKSGSGGADVWTGSFDDDPHSIFSLSIVGEAVDGYGISSTHGELQLTGRTDGELKLKSMKQLEEGRGFCQAAEYAQSGQNAPQEVLISPQPAASSSAPVVDILVVYTPLALVEAGSVNAITAKANAMVNSLNNVLSVSGVDVLVNLLHVAPVSHAGAGTTSDGAVTTLLTRLQSTTDGQMDEAHSLRNTHGADLVCVFGKATNFGVANIGGPWAAADFETANGVMPHEIGHNLGCGHNDSSGSGQTLLRGLYSYSYAHYVDFPTGQRGTIMSYIGQRTARFSNPDVIWDGESSGTATRDHARTISTFAPTAAAWKTKNTAPSITSIANQTTTTNTPTSALPFTIADAESALTALTVSATSSNLSLVPVSGITFGGSGASRNVTLTPLPNQIGSTTVSITVSDGILSVMTSFILTVQPAGSVTVTVVKNTPGTLNWMCPVGVNLVQVECWGGGGAGGSASKTSTTISAGGGGGAGGAYARRASVPVTPGNTYSLVVPATALAANPATTDGSRVNGSPVTFTGNGGVVITAAGGQGGASVVISSSTNTSGLGGVGGTVGCVGEMVLAGGDGAKAASAGQAGAGGGGAGNTVVGGDAVDKAAGLGGTLGGGDGGSGKSGNGGGNGVIGNGAGGGGGGARAQTTSGNAYTGASGGVGQIIITYTYIPVTNQPPVLVPFSNPTLIAGQTLQIASLATDTDTPAQTLTFSLVSPPIGASIHPTTGLFTWRPTIAQSSFTHTLTIKVADNGTPSLSATRSFQVTVQKPATPSLTVVRSTTGIANLSLTGDSGPDYEVEASGNLRDWQSIWTNGNAMPPFQLNDPEASIHDQRFYRVKMGP